MTPHEFRLKWTDHELKERSSYQEHFIDLCRMLDHPTPAEVDPKGETFCFEYGAKKLAGEQGFADVWKRDCFGWEYKGLHANLDRAYEQLLQYRESLENPPLLVVCDTDRIRVHTNFTYTATQTYEIPLSAIDDPESLRILRAVFTRPEALRPERTPDKVTEEAAARVGELADRLRARDVPPHDAAHFLMKLIFCLFAEDIGLLPAGLMTEVLSATADDPPAFDEVIRQLFRAMATGGRVLLKRIDHFNGGLFADEETVPLQPDELRVLTAVSRLDWSGIDPAIFGTLFERSLDPKRRAQLGAHYTSKDDILDIIEPVLMAPLREEWEQVRARCNALAVVAGGTGGPPVAGGTDGSSVAGGTDGSSVAGGTDGSSVAGGTDGSSVAGGTDGSSVSAVGTSPPPHARAARATPSRARAKAQKDLQREVETFIARIASVRVLDPACGSGNFLYVALSALNDLEKEVMQATGPWRVTVPFRKVDPSQLYGIEIDPYAAELAQLTVWIGYLQWMHSNGYLGSDRPILKPLHNIEQRDAILTTDEHGSPAEPEWPEADVIVGNPPFLGGKKLRTELGSDYVDRLFRLYRGRVPHEADLCCYWFQRARTQIETGRARRAGLLATNSIRVGTQMRPVLQKVIDTGGIFMAWSDRAWILDGAAVRISMVGFDDGAQQQRVLDGAEVDVINADLTAGPHLQAAKPLRANTGICFMGDTKGGAFDIPEDVARAVLAAPSPAGRENTAVVRPWCNGWDIARRPRGMWIIDFGCDMSEGQAALYEAPFEHVREHVWPERKDNRRKAYAERWWLHVEPRPTMRAALAPLPRYIATPRVAKYRLFVWLPAGTLTDSSCFVF
ncbi:MAG: class I SAM-dependent DNA methyltransferase, partial [Armatimonadetes bacterium]|nr:class I SAM-dependent DNA methyltransferase [Armatimonadota bacterium]